MKTIENINDFELLINNTFDDIRKNTLLYKFKEINVLHIELGGPGKNIKQRLEQANRRSDKILQYCFSGKPIWLRIILWTDREEKNLKDAGFKIYKAEKVIRQQVAYEALEEYEADGKYDLLYLYFKRFSKDDFSPIIQSIINHDMAIDPSAQITCYYINFKAKLIINIYDDRGLLIYTPDNELLHNIKTQFYEWLL